MGIASKFRRTEVRWNWPILTLYAHTGLRVCWIWITCHKRGDISPLICSDTYSQFRRKHFLSMHWSENWLRIRAKPWFFLSLVIRWSQTSQSNPRYHDDNLRRLSYLTECPTPPWTNGIPVYKQTIRCKCTLSYVYEIDNVHLVDKSSWKNEDRCKHWWICCKQENRMTEK